ALITLFGADAAARFGLVGDGFGAEARGREAAEERHLAPEVALCRLAMGPDALGDPEAELMPQPGEQFRLGGPGELAEVAQNFDVSFLDDVRGADPDPELRAELGAGDL